MWCCFTSNHHTASYNSLKSLYNFPLPLYALDFQSAFREKHLLQTFHVDTIRSKRGYEASDLHLKLWSDFDGENESISFLQHKMEPNEWLDFPINVFTSQLGSHEKGKNSIEMRFKPALIPPKLLKKRSRGSVDKFRRASLASIHSFVARRRSSTSLNLPFAEPMTYGKSYFFYYCYYPSHTYTR
jgi:hypothetical protein